jgi:hypothetical protein
LPARPCVENTSSGIKPCKGVIRFVSFDYAISGLNDAAHPVRRALPARFALPCAIDYALSELITSSDHDWLKLQREGVQKVPSALADGNILSQEIKKTVNLFHNKS